MKFNLTSKLGAALLLCCAASLTSCHDDDDELNITVRLNETQIAYDMNGVWKDVATNSSFQSQYMNFSHAGEMGAWGLVWSGFTPARSAVSVLPDMDWLSGQFQVMPAGGMSGQGTPYIVAYWNTQENNTTPSTERSCRIYYASNPTGKHYTFTPMSVYVTNTSYAYYTMKEGNNFCSAFNSDDYLVLIAHGVHADGSEATARFYLAGADASGNLAIVDSWEQFSLSSLGEVSEIYFTMESSRNSSWGMDAPAYFGLDCLTFRAKLPGK